MPEFTRVNFHCHSDLSDGAHAPETVAVLLAKDGVRYASLTDHDCVDGWERFQDALQSRGVDCISGVEITSHWRGQEIHLLAYGFDTRDADLTAMLHDIRKQRRIGLQTVIDSLRTTFKGRAESADPVDEDLEKARPLPPYDAKEVFACVHHAGGIVFLAHPWTVTRNPDELTRLLSELQDLGLDGVEVFSPEVDENEQNKLLAIARTRNLLVSGGTDLHDPGGDRGGQVGIAMPTDKWKQFRDALQHASAKPDDDGRPLESAGELRWKQLAIRLALPALLTIGLFLFANFAIVIPTVENRLIERKRETAAELTATVVSLLEEYHRDETEGLLSREKAQTLAAERIRDLRYGPDKKDYFWIIDQRPVMVMHPYRPELDDTDLSTFADEEGNLLFVNSVEAVEGDGEGFVDYVWQWQDDRTRIQAKESHVRLFRPWGWIVGTGIYVKDVQTEISRLTSRLVWTAVLITLLVSGLLAYILQQGLQLERQRGRAHAAMRQSHEKYRLLVETATEGTLLLVDGKCAFANRAMLDLLGYAPEEFRLLDWRDLMPADADDAATRDYVADLMEGKPAPLAHIGKLRRKSGEHVTLHLTCQSLGVDDRHTLFLSARDAAAVESSASSAGSPASDAALEDLQASLLFLTEPLSRFPHASVSCSMDTTIEDAAHLMTRHGFSAALVHSESGLPIGIITDGDLRRRVLAADGDASRPVVGIMSSPLVTIDDHALVHEALLLMEQKKVRHIAVRNPAGKVTSIVRRADLLGFHRYASAVIVGEIERSQSLRDVVAARERVPAIVSSLVEATAKPRSVTRLLSSVHDAATDRVVRIAMEDLGPPPARFCFLCMGSEGREEETLTTDQDNGIIYEDVAPEQSEAAQAYFESLGAHVCDALDAVGYRYCKGGVMARSHEWCGPIGKWRNRFKHWINGSESTDILRIDMCFDFRAIYGADDLTVALREFIFDEVERRPEFLGHFARNAMQYKPPLGFFGTIGSRDSGEPDRSFNVKEAMMPIVKFARIYALRHRIAPTNTLERLARMVRLDLISESGHDDTVLAYEFLMDLRLRHQADLIRRGEAPDNKLRLKSIPHLEEVTLREALSQIATIQKRVGYDFLGTPET